MNKSEIGVVVIAIVVFVVLGYAIFSYKEEWRLEFTSKLVDFKPPSFGYSGCLIFENGRVIPMPRDISLYDLQIGKMYNVYRSNCGIWKIEGV